MGPYEAFLSGKPVITTTDAGGPLDVVHDRRTGLVVAPEATAVGRGRRLAPRARGRGGVLRRGGQGARRRGDVGPGDREAARVKVAYFSPMPPESSGIADYSALLVPGAARARRRRDRAAQGRSGPRAGRTSPSTTSATTPTPTAGSSTRCAGRRGSSSSTTSCSITWSRRHHRARGRSRLPRRDGAGARRRRAAPRPRRARQAAAAALGGPAGGLPAHGRGARLAKGVVVHSRYVADRARAAGFDGPIVHVPHPAWPVPASRPPSSTGDPLVGAFGNVNASKRVPQLLEAFARLRRERPGARLLLVGATSPGFDLDRRLQRLGLAGDGLDPRGLRGGAAALVADGRLRRPRRPPLADDGRDVGHGDPRAHARQAARRDGRGLVLGAARATSRSRCPSASARSTSSRPRSACSPSGRTSARRWAPPRAGWPQATHDLARVAELQAAAFERVAGGRAVADGVLREVSGAAAEVGIAPGSPEASEIARRLSEVDLGA